jgi:CheY-like chemotaxis protein
VPKTLLAIDDSATMRKVLEITFAGDDFRVVTADSFQSALTNLREEPAIAVIDTVLDGEDGYALAKEVRSRLPHVAIVLLTSRYSPYDAGRGRDSGADDYLDKPFDTQALLDKVKKALAAHEASKAVAAPPRPAPMPPSAPTAQQLPAVPYPPLAVPRTNSPAVARPVYPTQRTHTLSFEGTSPAAPPLVPAAAATPQPAAVAVNSPRPAVAEPMPPLASTSTPPPAGLGTTHSSDARQAPIATSISAALDGDRLASLGLTTEQMQGLLALSRDVIERVVWEVAPQLAEVMIREEIARLTKD